MGLEFDLPPRQQAKKWHLKNRNRRSQVKVILTFLGIATEILPEGQRDI